MPSRSSFSLVLVVLAGCATGRAHPSVECEVHEGVAWTQLETEHFRIRTPLPAPRARYELRHLERWYALLRTLLGAKEEPRRPLDVVYLEDSRSLGRFGNGRKLAGVFLKKPQRLLVTSARKTNQVHELTHAVVRQVFHQLPPWLNEGLARYLETATITEEGTIHVGRVDPVILGRLQAGGLVPLETLWAWDGDVYQDMRGTERTAHYDSAWAWVHFLVNEEPRRLEQWLMRLARVQRAKRARQTFERLFSPDAQPELESRVRAYVHRTEFALTAHPIPATSKWGIRPMRPAEVHVARALATHDLPREVLLDELAIAASLDPNEPVLELVRARMEIDPWLEQAATALAKNKLEEARALVEKARQRVPDDPEVLRLAEEIGADSMQPPDL